MDTGTLALFISSKTFLFFVLSKFQALSLFLGPIIVGRRESDNSAILFSKLGLNCIKPENEAVFKNQKRYLKWLCAAVFGLDSKHFGFNSVRQSLPL